jgi:hypothetical protein
MKLPSDFWRGFNDPGHRYPSLKTERLMCWGQSETCENETEYQSPKKAWMTIVFIDSPEPYHSYRCFQDVIDCTLGRVPKAYPARFDIHGSFETL